jgi:hypothetical protein
MSAHDIIAICQRHIAAHADDCAGFVKAVASECGVLVAGGANVIVNTLPASGRLPDGLSAARKAATGDLVIAGADAPGNGHVVVVVDGPLNRGRYPYAFWGQYHGIRVGTEERELNVGFTRGHGTLNWAFRTDDLKRVKYATFKPLAKFMPRAKGNEGFLIHTFT